MVMGQVRAMRAQCHSHSHNPSQSFPIDCSKSTGFRPDWSSVYQWLWPKMRARQLNAQEREQLRRERSETRMILARCRAQGHSRTINHINYK